MIKVMLEVSSGINRFKVAVWAESIEQALDVASAYYSGYTTRVVFPIDPEAFFAKGLVPSPDTVLPWRLEEATG
jgi:hypothetical protein